MKIKFNSDGELSLNKTIEIPISSTLNGGIKDILPLALILTWVCYGILGSIVNFICQTFLIYVIRKRIRQKIF